MSKVFTDVYGQKRAINTLSSHLISNNLSHAYLFLGEEGTGKEHLAREFAKYILCGNNQADDCESCRKFGHNSHPDFILIDGHEGIKIEDIRGVVERINLSPGLSTRKVLLITKLENIGLEAANSLLKTLEEPPLDSVILMTSNSEKRLPETIISRTQQIKLQPLSNDNIYKILAKEFDKSEIDKVIKLADGSIGEAKKLILDGEKYNEKSKMIKDISKIFSSNSVIEKFKIIEDYEKSKKLKIFFNIFQKVLISGIYARILDEEIGLSGIIPRDIKVERLQDMAKKTLKIYADLDYNISLRIAMEEMILKDIYA